MRQILFAGAIGLFLTLVGTPLLIKLLARKGYGQFIRDDGPRTHGSKKGTPTMGGIAFILATIIAYVLAKVITGEEMRFSGVLVLFLMAGMGLVGFLDDYIKIVKQRSPGPARQGEDGRPADRRHRLRGALAPVRRPPRQHPGLDQALLRRRTSAGRSDRCCSSSGPCS